MKEKIAKAHAYFDPLHSRERPAGERKLGAARASVTMSRTGEKSVSVTRAETSVTDEYLIASLRQTVCRLRTELSMLRSGRHVLERKAIPVRVATTVKQRPE